MGGLFDIFDTEPRLGNTVREVYEEGRYWVVSYVDFDFLLFLFYMVVNGRLVFRLVVYIFFFCSDPAPGPLRDEEWGVVTLPFLLRCVVGWEPRCERIEERISWGGLG